MQRYKIMEEIGAGTYGIVWKATHDSGEVVAIKRLKENFHSWSDCMILRELETLRSVSNHENIVGIKELIREENSQLHFVFEYCDTDVLQTILELTKKNLVSPYPGVMLTAKKVHSIIRQVLTGLEHMHSRGYFHRDIKPENLLMRGETCKIADFGLARKHRCNSNAPPLTEYISTRWYRAPEVLLRSPDYGTPIDIFAVGLVMVELLMLRPLLPGTSDIDQIHKMLNLLGRPGKTNWPKGMGLMQKMMLCLPSDNLSLISSSKRVPLHMVQSRKYLEQMMPKTDASTIYFVHRLLKLDPSERPTAGECLTADCLQLHSRSVNAGKVKSSLQHDVPIVCHARNATPLLEKEATSMRGGLSTCFRQPSMPNRSIVVTSKQSKLLLQQRKKSTISNRIEKTPFSSKNFVEQSIAHDHFTNFQYTQSTTIRPTLIERIPQQRQKFQDEKSNKYNGFGLTKFRQHF